MSKLPFVVLVVVSLGLAACGGAAPTTPTVAPDKAGLANPASVFCEEKGGKVNIVADASGGQVGLCVFPDGSQCEEWTFYRGTCTPKKAGAALTLDALKNAEYQSEFPASKKARLADGKYEEEIVPGTASKLTLVLYPVYAMGDLNGDGADDAAVILVADSGGSGSFYHLAAVVNQNGTPKHIASTSLGDRVKIEAISIQSGVITVNMVTHGPQDPLCCPTLKAIKTFKLQSDKLIPLS
jgi:putative hemolysin